LTQQIIDCECGREGYVALKCTGAESSIEAAIEAVRFGGTVFVVGIGKNEMVFLFMRLSTREADREYDGVMRQLRSNHNFIH